jgi:hypothetical protein
LHKGTSRYLTYISFTHNLIVNRCSIFASLAVILAGACAFHVNEESYDIHFSFISRAAQSPSPAAVMNDGSAETTVFEKKVGKTKI